MTESGKRILQGIQEMRHQKQMEAFDKVLQEDHEVLRELVRRCYWRYQPVSRGEGDDTFITLCECYFDGDNRLTSWTENPSMHPGGNDPAELIGDLSNMMLDAEVYAPVPFESLKVGMIFDFAPPSVALKIARAFNARYRRTMKALAKKDITAPLLAADDPPQ